MTDKLMEYKQKRSFDVTAEPCGKAEQSTISKSANAKLRFVVQHHIATRDHFDLRLEYDGVLLSWAVPKGPSFCTADKRMAIRVEDHPLEYRNFEGNIPQGQYGGGVVMLWDEGFWQCKTDIKEGLAKGSLKFELMGKRLKGNWAMVKIRQDNGWLLIKEKDNFAQPTSGILQYETSIRTGRTMEQIRQDKPSKTNSKAKQQNAKNPFCKVEVELARLCDSLPKNADGNWLYELKYDGYRIVSFVEDGKVRLVSRNDNDYSQRFAQIAVSIAQLLPDRAAVLDGEVVIADDSGRTDFQALQSFVKNPQGKQLNYIIFDILALDGQDLRQRPLTERRAILQQVLANSCDNLLFSQASDSLCDSDFDSLCQQKYEGIVAKKANSAYKGGRNGDWVKCKCDTRQEFVVGGFVYTSNKTDGISALLLGQMNNSNLVYVGRAGTGFTQKTSSQLRCKLLRIERKTCPFEVAPKISNKETVVWVKPQFAAETKFAEWTKENLLRQASFKGLLPYEPQSNLSENKSAVKKSKVNITNAQKLMFTQPKITKGEVADYYARISERMLPYIKNRILSLICCPKGISDPCFYKKHPFADNSGVVPVNVVNSKSKVDTFFTVQNLDGMLYAVQMNSVEFHCWASCADSVDAPDMMVFDLDPDEGVPIERVRQGARDLKSILDQLNLVSFLKTSGGKGYHIVVPFAHSSSYANFLEFSRKVCEVMEQKWTDRYTTNIRKVNRKGKIFVDFLRNSRGATSVAPYSLRARKGATVSCPIDWEELDTIAPDAITLTLALERLTTPDPWSNFFKVMSAQRLD